MTHVTGQFQTSLMLVRLWLQAFCSHVLPALVPALSAALERSGCGLGLAPSLGSLAATRQRGLLQY